MGSFKSLGKCVVKMWREHGAKLLQPKCGHVKIRKRGSVRKSKDETDTGWSRGWDREVGLGVAHLIFIDAPSDINTLMKLARWPNYKLLQTWADTN